MGMMYADHQEKAAHYLVRVLDEQNGRVHYSHFYGTDEARAALCAGMEIDDDDEADWIGAEGVMDEAAAAMERQGFVTLIWHDGEELADGEPAYSIMLTEDGKNRLAAGEFPTFRNLDL